MSDIKFIYLYRDGANYKSWGEVVFSNPEQLSLDEIEKRLIAAFLPDKLFIANQISIPERFLFSEGRYTKYDHCYHEFDCVEICEEIPTDVLGRSINSFVQDVEIVTGLGWKAFEILDRA